MDTSHAGPLKDWEGFAGACRADCELENFLSGDLDTFDEVLRDVWSALTRRSKLESEKRKATKELNDALYKAREQARQLRLGIQLHLGLRNERLKVFGIKPLR
jgi:hypothetical protein